MLLTMLLARPQTIVLLISIIIQPVSTDGAPFHWFHRGTTSLLRIDPRKIISTMVKNAGLVLPSAIEQDLKVLDLVCRCETCFLDVLNRELEVRNFAVSPPRSAPGKEDALRVGKVHIKWDSYAKPCVEIEVDDVDVLVDFMNLVLTKNNW